MIGSLSASVAATLDKLAKFVLVSKVEPILPAAVAKVGGTFTSIASASTPARPEPFVTFTV